MTVLRFQSPELPALADVQPYYALAADAGWYSNNGPCVQLLERRCSDFLGLPHPGVAVSNATAGLMVALRAAIGEPDPARPLVAVPSFTFVASVAAVVWSGWTPLFVDVDPHDWQVSDAALEGLANHQGRLAAVMLCSTFGTSPSPDRERRTRRALEELGRPVVVDSAAGFGSVDGTGAPLGARGDVEVFSFHATKPFAIGEGGLLTSADASLLDRARRLANFGFDEQRDLPGQIGLNAKLAELPAAVGLAVLDTFHETLTARRRAAAWLIEELRPWGVEHQAGNAGSTFQFVPVLMPTTAARERLLARAVEAEVEVRTYFVPPMHKVRRFSGFPALDACPTTDDLASRIVCLPMANRMTAQDLERTRDLVLSALA